MFAYCGNNPVNLTDPSGHLPQWIKDLWNDIKDFFSSETGKQTTSFDDGNSRGYAAVTAGYSEFSLGGMGQNQPIDRKRDRYATDGYAGISGSASLIHGCTGAESWQNSNLGMSGEATVDVLSLTGYAGYQYKNGLGVGAGAYAAAFSGSAAITLDICGWKLVMGINADVGAIGLEAQAGFTNGVAECKVKGAAGIGVGFVVQVEMPERFY